MAARSPTRSRSAARPTRCMVERMLGGPARTESACALGAVTVVDRDRAAARALARREVAMYVAVVAPLDADPRGPQWLATCNTGPARRLAGHRRRAVRRHAGSLRLLRDARRYLGQVHALRAAGASRVEFGTPHGIDPRPASACSAAGGPLRPDERRRLRAVRPEDRRRGDPRHVHLRPRRRGLLRAARRQAQHARRQAFCLYALQPTLPLLPAKQRPLQPADWMETDMQVICADPLCGVVMRIERTERRVVHHADVSAVPCTLYGTMNRREQHAPRSAKLACARMASFSSEDLQTLATTFEVGIEPTRKDGSLGRRDLRLGRGRRRNQAYYIRSRPRRRRGLVQSRAEPAARPTSTPAPPPGPSPSPWSPTPPS